MTTPSEEELMAQLLSAWLEDLRQDHQPRQNELALRLSAEKAAEVMDLARWYKAILYPTSGPSEGADAIASKVGDRVIGNRQTDAAAVAETIRGVDSFDEVLRSVAARLHIDLANLEEACGLRKMELLEVAAGTQPGHRLPVEAMIRVFRGLRLPATAIDTLRRSSLEWAQSHATESQVQLNRPAPEPEPHLERDQENTSSAVELYCAELRERLA